MFTMGTENDTPLVEACIKKDALAWERLLSRYSPIILASIKNRLRRYGFDPACEDVEDIKQNVIAAIWREDKLASVRNRNSIACWLSIVSGNMAILYMRKKLSYTPKLMPITGGADESALIDSVCVRTDISSELDAKELIRKIEGAIEALPSKEKLVAKLHFMYGKKFHEISEMLRMPMGTVASCVKRAKTKLRERLRSLYEQK